MTVNYYYKIALQAALVRPLKYLTNFNGKTYSRPRFLSFLPRFLSFLRFPSFWFNSNKTYFPAKPGKLCQDDIHAGDSALMTSVLVIMCMSTSALVILHRCHPFWWFCTYDICVGDSVHVNIWAVYSAKITSVLVILRRCHLCWWFCTYNICAGDSA
jgi:hypothetical protein